MNDEFRARLSYAQAVDKAVSEALAADSRVLILGVGVTHAPYTFGLLAQSYKDYPGRFLETPLSEAAITGAAIGLAQNGYRPIIVHARADFSLLALDQVVNNLAMWPDPLPVTIMTIVGRGWGQGPQHSKSLQATYAHFPNLQVYMPYRPADGYCAVRHALGTGLPTILALNRRNFSAEGNVPINRLDVFWAGGNVLRLGDDVTIVGSAGVLQECEQAAENLKSIGISAMVVDPQALPLVAEYPGWLCAAMRKTGHVVIVDDSWATCGLSAEIAALVATNCPGVQAVRVTPPFVAAPVSMPLEAAWYPTALQIATAACDLLGKELAVCESEAKVQTPAGGPF